MKQHVGAGTANANWLCKIQAAKSRGFPPGATPQNKGSHQGSYQEYDPSYYDGVYYDRVHHSFESRRHGHKPAPVSGQRFYNKETGYIEVYEDLRSAPVYREQFEQCDAAAQYKGRKK
jgi:hypothetical protein